MKTNILETLESRDLLQDVSDREGLVKLADGDAFYIGFDPTAPSLQVGNLIPLIVSAHLAKAGLKPIVLFGGATGAIGDPSGKNQERQLLSSDVINKNIQRQISQTTQIMDRLGIAPEFVNNIDWIGQMDVLSFLRDVGKHFTVNYMIAKEVVKTRLGGEGISFTEFSYMLLQALDFAHLFQEKNCKLQIGGSDQWGNITAGLEYIRRKQLGQAYALSWPLLTNSQGKKFGKSEGGAIWLGADYTSAYRFHQFWLNIDDQDAISYLKIFTFHSLEEIDEIAKASSADPQKRVAQKALADAVCTLVHGPDATAEAKKSAEALFGGSVETLTEAQLEDIFSEVPSTELSQSALADGTMLDVFVACGLSSSRGEAKRLIKDGGAYVNNQRVSDLGATLKDCGVAERKVFFLRSGKKKYHLVRVTNG
jgi:tyrosyl-tRNA synthetase